MRFLPQPAPAGRRPGQGWSGLPGRCRTPGNPRSISADPSGPGVGAAGLPAAQPGGAAGRRSGERAAAAWADGSPAGPSGPSSSTHTRRKRSGGVGRGGSGGGRSRGASHRAGGTCGRRQHCGQQRGAAAQHPRPAASTRWQQGSSRRFGGGGGTRGRGDGGGRRGGAGSSAHGTAVGRRAVALSLWQRHAAVAKLHSGSGQRWSCSREQCADRSSTGSISARLCRNTGPWSWQPSSKRVAAAKRAAAAAMAAAAALEWLQRFRRGHRAWCQHRRACRLCRPLLRPFSEPHQPRATGAAQLW